ncbi:MAG: GTP-binding protein [Candidatus Nanoarchaeia archaeon]|nr:GTP-binding protein [Candidatus Nanoarchaeia archaeon]
MGEEEIKSRIKEIEEEIAKTPYNKASEHHIGTLKGKIAKLKEKLEIQASSKAGGAKGYNVKKTGDATVVLVGFPSVGKSTLINKITNTKSKVAHYAFTTTTSIPGTMQYKNMDIQIVDLPGIIEGASEGKGRGKEIVSVARSSDLILIMIEAFETDKYDIIKKELYDLGIRLDGYRPDIKIQKKSKGGIDIGSTLPLTKLTKETIKSILNEYGHINASVVIREDVSVDRFIDLLSKNIYYVPSLVVINKMDLLNDTEIRMLKAKYPDAVFISAESGINISELKDKIIERLGFIRIFLKKPNQKPDMEEPLIIRKSESTVGDVCNKIHTSFAKKLRFAKIWGESAKFGGQQVGKNHKLTDKDIVEFHWV